MTQPDIRVLAGSPTPEELAAITVAVIAVTTAPPAKATPAAWSTAARREALGGRPAASPADLRGPV